MTSKQERFVMARVKDHEKRLQKLEAFLKVSGYKSAYPQDKTESENVPLSLEGAHETAERNNSQSLGAKNHE